MRLALVAIILATVPAMSFGQGPFGRQQGYVFNDPLDIPTTKPNPKYPIQVHLYPAGWRKIRDDYFNFSGHSFIASGRGDLLGTAPKRFEYTVQCGRPFSWNTKPEETYQARWTRQDKELELFLLRPRNGHTERCYLKTSIKSDGSWGKEWHLAMPGD